MKARLFAAVNFDDTTRSRLLLLCDELRSRSERGNFSLPENLHLTLAFIGECDMKQAAAAKNSIDAINFERFDIRIERVGRFRRHGGDVWWAGLRKSEPLLRLQSELTLSLIDAGFALDRREYKPHVTLGREVVTDAVPWQIEPFGEAVSSIELMKSERIAGKLTYTAIHIKRTG